MKKIIYLAIIIVLTYGFEQKVGVSLFETNVQFQNADASSVQTAYNNKQSNLQVMDNGIVSKILADDNKGSRHQKFILKLNNLSILIAHNIDLAARIETLQVGDRVAFNGEYEWNSKGGIVHWTHHDPAGRHVNGWLKHKGKTFQ